MRAALAALLALAAATAAAAPAPTPRPGSIGGPAGPAAQAAPAGPATQTGAALQAGPAARAGLGAGAGATTLASPAPRPGAATQASTAANAGQAAQADAGPEASHDAGAAPLVGAAAQAEPAAQSTLAGPAVRSPGAAAAVPTPRPAREQTAARAPLGPVPTPRPGGGGAATAPAAAAFAAAPLPPARPWAPLALDAQMAAAPTADPAPFADFALRKPAPSSAAAPTPSRAAAPERARVELAALTPTPRTRPGGRLSQIPGVGDDGAGLCGDPRLQGARVPEIEGRGACGVARPVRLTAVAGVRLAQPATVGCAVARTLADWIEDVAKPSAEADLGARLTGLDFIAGYSCRTMNSRVGARLSKHALGDAIDVGVFKLSDGRKVSVLNGWRGAADERRFLRRAHRGACGAFGTVLGPDSDRWHRNHFHLDVANHRNGAYCR